MCAQDYDGVYALWLRIKGFAIRSIDDSENNITRFLERNPGMSHVALEDGKVVGAILCAMGYSGVVFDPERVSLYIESELGALQIVRDGAATDYSEEKAAEIFSAKEITCIADLNAGTEQAVAWGCDLTYEYVKINGDYRS